MLARSVVAMFVFTLAAAPTLAQVNIEKRGNTRLGATAPTQRYQCQVGPLKKQTRLVMETIKGSPVYLAYWSSNGPFHCSFESWPNDGRAQWVKSTAGMLINLISGSMLIKREHNRYVLHARDVDRMTYCGTEGVISGILTVPTRKGNCTWVESASNGVSESK